MENKNVNAQELEAIKEKIRNILNRTVANGATEEEAKAAAKLAQKLMAQYGIDEHGIMAQARDLGAIVKVFVRESIKEYEVNLGNCIAKNFKTKFITGWFTPKQGAPHGGCKATGFWGRQFDVDVAVMTYTTMLALLWTNATARIGSPKGRAKDAWYWQRINDYGFGFVEGLEEAFNQNIQQNALVVVMDQECQDIAKTFGRKNTRSRGYNPNSSDFSEGLTKGRMAFKAGMVDD